ncbi:MAG: DUF4147 domain-containing protein [bacterium]|nr:DUF4147 domain-containing protein [bacterium]
MIIKNFAELATSKLRRDALGIIEAAYNSINTKKVIENSVRLHKNGLLYIKDNWVDLKKYRRVYLIGIGKAAFASVSVLEDLLKDYITDGIVLDIYGAPLKKVKSIVGTHPHSTETNVAATREIVALLQAAQEEDLVLTVITGGGSALLCSPYKISCDLKDSIVTSLWKAGATIQEMNVVRKHLSGIKGGHFASLAYPAKVVSLIFSDVPGDDLSAIGSGPTVLDPTTVKDAAAILAKYDVLKACNLPNCELQETPKDPMLFQRVVNVVVVNDKVAVDAMEEMGRRLKYNVEIFSSEITGEAQEVAKELVMNAKTGTVLLAAGESTVRVIGNGKGGRNQHLVLSALKYLKDGQVIVSVNSDGYDFTTHAGAIGDRETIAKAKRKRLQIEKYLKNCDSFHFFEKVGDAIQTGILGTNVADFMLVLSK